MKKTILFLLILGIVLIFASCINNTSKTSVKITLKGTPISLNTSKEAFESSWNYIIFELKDSKNIIIEHIETTKEEFYSSGIEFTRDNFTGNYNAYVSLIKKADKGNNSGDIQVGGGSCSYNFKEGLNEVVIDVSFNNGSITFSPKIYDNITYLYNISLYNKNNEKFDMAEELSQSGRTEQDVPAGVYLLKVTIKNGDSVEWSNVETPYMLEVFPGQNTEVIFDPLSKGKLILNLPYELKPYDLTTTQNGTSTNVVLTWKYNLTNLPGEDTRYYIYKKVPNARNYSLAAEITYPFTGLSIEQISENENMYKFTWTDSNENYGKLNYQLNIIKSYSETNQETGNIDFNEVTVKSIVKRPVFSVSGGTYHSPQTITISTATGDAEIYYTTDGNTPDISSNKYSEPINITSNTTLKAVAVKSGMLDSDIAAAEYNVSYWRTLGEEWLSDYANCQNISISSDNIPYVAFQDTAANWKPTIKKLINNHWITVGNAGISSNMAENIKLVLDHNDVPYVAFKDLETNKATVMKYDSTENIWIVVGSESFSQGEVKTLSVAVNSDNIPYVSYQDKANSDKLTVMKFDSTQNTWVTVGNTGFSDTSAYYTNILFDNNDVPYVVYQEFGNGTYKASARKFDGENWISVGPSAGFSSGTATMLTAVFDSDNVLYTAFKDFTSDYKATVMKYNGESWSVVGSAGISSGETSYLSLAVNKNNVPYVAFSDSGNSMKPAVMNFNGETWVTTGNSNFTPGSGVWTAIAIDHNNIPYVIYQDWANFYKTSVKVYK